MPERSRTGILLRTVDAPENSFANTTKTPLRFGVLGAADINQNGRSLTDCSARLGVAADPARPSPAPSPLSVLHHRFA